jgi:hypothetical protein
MSETVFVIPSLGRSESVGKCAVKTLTDLEVSPKDIHIFVANEEEKKKYQAAVPNVGVVVGELGIGNQRKFINGYFPGGTRIVSIDDDVLLVKKDGNKASPLTGNLVEYVKRAYGLCEDRGVRFWGITDSVNGMFMGEDAVYGLRSCAGAFYGEYSQEVECQSERDHCEDLEKQLKHYLKYGGIIRFNNVGPKQKRYGSGGVVQHLGGMAERLAVYEKSALDLCDKYPDLVKAKKDYNVKKGITRFRDITHERISSVF